MLFYLITGSNAKSGWLHFRRNSWLLVFGFGIHTFFFPGDILVTYALSGFVLWFLRNWSARSLLILATFLFSGSVQNFVMKSSLEISRDIAEEMEISISKGEDISEETAEWAQAWMEYEDDIQNDLFCCTCFFISGCANDDDSWHGIIQAWYSRWRQRN